MSGGIQTTIRGHLGAAAIVKTVHDSNVCELRVAVQTSRKDSDGVWQKIATEWVDVAAWGRLSSECEDLQKGQLVEVRGVLTPGAYISRDGEAVATSKLTAYAVLLPASVARTETAAGAGSWPAPVAVAS